MVEDVGHSEQEDLYGARIDILGTNLGSPEEGRIFVWTEMGWFERLEGESGNVAFTHVADSEEELRRLISQDSPQADLNELGGKFRKMVSEEFVEQSLSLADTPEDLSEEPDEDAQEFHQHD